MLRNIGTLSPSIICIDVGYSRTRYGVWTGNEIVGYYQSRTPKKTDRTEDPTPSERRENWLRNLEEHVYKLRLAYPAAKRAALCFPGIVHRDGTIWRINSIWGAAHDDVPPHYISKRLGLPVVICNDLHAAATRYGSDPRYSKQDSILVLSVSSGIGTKTYSRAAGGVILEPRGRNGEIGLTLVDYSEEALTNDNGRLKGVLGNYASGVGFTRLLRFLSSREPESSLFEQSLLKSHLITIGSEILSIDRDLLNSIAVECIKRGDKFTKTILTRSIGYLARILHTIILYDRPGAIVVTGGFSISLGEIYRQILIDHLTALFTFLYEKDELDQMISLGEEDDLDNLIGCGILANSASIRL